VADAMIEAHLRTLENGQTKGERRTHVSGLLYRGQSDSSWGLATTLERSDTGNLSLRQYYRLISAVKPQVEALTGTEWSAPDIADYDAWLSERNHMAVAPPGYEYMIYLRHYGFPSPLLDWTRSAYIAAYFAFRHAHHDAKSIAIFAYREYLGHGKSWTPSEPHIHGLGRYIRTHRRHFLQQSEYTVCVVRDAEWRYAPHENAFARGESEQDALWKLCIPSTERLKVLRLLDRANLNAYSLFGTDETLMETLAFRELDAREGDL
jgi:hypothetical protein